MRERTSEERDRDFERDQARYFHRFKQTLCDPECRKAWATLERLAREERQARQQAKKVEREILDHWQAQELLQDHRGSGLRSTDPVWGPKIRKWQRATKGSRLAQAKYEEAERALRQRFRFPLIPGPRDGVSLADLQKWKWKDFLAMPTMVEGQHAAEQLLYADNRLVLALNLDHPDRAILASVDGCLRVLRANSSARPRSRFHPDVEAFRSKVVTLKALGMKRKRIAGTLLPDEMKSKDPRIRKRALQRITDALRSPKQ